MVTRQWQGGHRYGNGTKEEFLDLVREVSGFTGPDLVRLNSFMIGLLQSAQALAHVDGPQV